MTTPSLTVTGHALELSQEDLLSLLIERFGKNVYDWAFQCPSCKDVATGQDFKDALTTSPITRKDGTEVTASDLLGQQCIGRTLGVLDGPAEEWQGRGCDWAAHGLFRGPVRVTLPDGGEVYSFPVAEAAKKKP